MTVVTTRVDVAPEMLQWALERADLTVDDLNQNSQKVFLDCISGKKPTVRQLESFAKDVHVPFAYLFLQEPPVDDPKPITDFRTLGSQSPKKFSFNLRTVIETAQFQQDWYEEALEADSVEPLSFVESVKETDSPTKVAEQIRQALELDIYPINTSSKQDFRKQLVSRIENLGVVVQISGTVNGNSHRSLNVEEFRGFALNSKMAPFIFVNGKDAITAQNFTLIHELAHIWAGQTGVSDSSKATKISDNREIWANQVAANVLVPNSELQQWWQKEQIATIEDPTEQLDKIKEFADKHGVSKEVVVRRTYGLKKISFEWQEELIALIRERYAESSETSTNKKTEKTGQGGDYYRTTQLRIGKTLAREIINSANNGSLSYRDAFRLLNVSNIKKFDKLAEKLTEA